MIFKVIGQGNRVKFLGEGVRQALRCPCLFLHSFFIVEYLTEFGRWFQKQQNAKMSKTKTNKQINNSMPFLIDIENMFPNTERNYL